jgi:hypothetical protein
MRMRLAIIALVLATGLALGASNSAHALPRLALCSNHIDDDGDGKVDFRADPGCRGVNDNNGEVDPVPLPACSDGIDNDLDGKIDYPAEPGCPSAANNNEANPAVAPACSDGIDNDGDGKIDYPADPGCNWAADVEADRACSDGIDNDSDGKVDFPNDPGCANVNDANEADPPQCDDGIDNDADGTLDFGVVAGQTPDTDCASATDTVEAPAPLPPPRPAQCSDGLDNDLDGKIDFPADRGCFSALDDDETDPPAPPSPPRPAPAPVVVRPPAPPTVGSSGDPFIVLAVPTAIVEPPLLTPVPIVRLRGRSEGASVRITLLTVRAPAASDVTITCSGRKCPMRRWAIRSYNAIVRVRPFERRLRGGTVLSIYVTKPGFIGKFTRFRFLSNRVPLRVDRCATTPGSGPHRCPGS